MKEALLKRRGSATKASQELGKHNNEKIEVLASSETNFYHAYITKAQEDKLIMRNARDKRVKIGEEAKVDVAQLRMNVVPPFAPLKHQQPKKDDHVESEGKVEVGNHQVETSMQHDSFASTNDEDVSKIMYSALEQYLTNFIQSMFKEPHGMMGT
uniref:Uncharacterized protein n=1 Tax=Nelumbo nucifera TaxID=4432 RepID=A0A822YZJ3_NELNU|nr:TPA_asm: hypothetical protein HUJ06_007286 [Nelumbo nucifera]